MEGINKTIELVCRYHEGQLYGNKNYVNAHLQPVAKESTLVLVRQEMGANPPVDFRDTVYIIGLLHDIIEDTEMTEQELRDLGYSDDIVEAVVAITKTEDQSRKQYLNKVKENYLALIVKKADTMVNLTNSYKQGDHKRISKYTKQLAYLFKED